MKIRFGCQSTDRRETQRLTQRHRVPQGLVPFVVPNLNVGVLAHRENSLIRQPEGRDVHESVPKFGSYSDNYVFWAGNTQSGLVLAHP